MCNLITEGTKFGCGHYVITRKVSKIDCGNKRCVHSAMHRRPCPDCYCEKFMGPDREERVTLTIGDKYCDHCSYWYQSKGRRQ
ncbi:uncharacterized protein FOMMEDRAFT_20143 [Fomitiporia mediterranea MF3/22]|uniref:uncharacterized protein n=1 Tax=Fomitiporia mediterranea (strain MF3/22) TaxID=694068 RepID=UPI0004407D20|nr:uncharacterized protein FOMMEDRAFT_20143 [Fomitiporia mediterranea MF3/22]EJD02949.1 hypothetical protein FOMMEDRAFT_20143 [Fomitiporia mediterranea MF3/22]